MVTLSGSHLFPSVLDLGDNRLRCMITTPQVQLASLRRRHEGRGEEKGGRSDTGLDGACQDHYWLISAVSGHN